MAQKAVQHRHLAPPPPTTPKSSGGKSTTTAPVSCSLQQPVILKEPTKPSARFAEVAGETAAECAAICCCCPCGLVNLLVCVVVKLPAGLCRQAYIKRKKRRIARKKKAALLRPKVGSTDDEEDGVGLNRAVAAIRQGWPVATAMPSPEVAEIEKEMWAKFYGTGFWRSPSQREDRAELEIRSRRTY